MAKIQEGEQVCILHTGETGILRQYLSDFTAMVDVNGDYRTVHITALEPAWLFNPGEKSAMSKSAPVARKGNGMPGILDGLHLLFQPTKTADEEVITYTLYLANRMDVDLMIHYSFYLNGTLNTAMRKDIGAGDDLLLHLFKTEQLNDLPAFSLEAWPKKPGEGISHYAEKELRIKPRQFFGGKYAIGEDGMLLFTFFEKLPTVKERIKIENKETDDAFDWEEHVIHSADPISKAGLKDSIDLHIEKLDPAWELLDKGEILQIQLTAFEEYMDAAIRHGLHKVYIVHGIGKGVLKEEIAGRLKNYPSVTSFNNEYHHRFGFGATEVHLE